MTQDKFRTTVGFTLIELMAVVTILGILVVIAIPKFVDSLRESKEASTKGGLGSIRSAIEIYYTDMEGEYPSDNLSSLTIDAKYLSAIPPAKVADYHATTTVVEDNGFWASTGPGDFGRWNYWNETIPGVGPLAGRNQGDLWVGCTHTDTKSTLWSTY